MSTHTHTFFLSNTHSVLQQVRQTQASSAGVVRTRKQLKAPQTGREIKIRSQACLTECLCDLKHGIPVDKINPMPVCHVSVETN